MILHHFTVCSNLKSLFSLPYSFQLVKNFFQSFLTFFVSFLANSPSLEDSLIIISKAVYLVNIFFEVFQVFSFDLPPSSDSSISIRHYFTFVNNFFQKSIKINGLTSISPFTQQNNCLYRYLTIIFASI